MAKDPIKTLQKMDANVAGQVAAILNKWNLKMMKHLITAHLTGGTTYNRLRRRSGALGRSIKPIPATAKGGMIEARLTTGVKYGPVHIGPINKPMVIRPKTKKFLAIPTKFAQTPAGVAKGGPLDPIWGKTFIQKGVIFGQPGGKGKPVPLFILKASVVVDRRIDPLYDLIWDIKKGLINDLKKAGFYGVQTGYGG